MRELSLDVDLARVVHAIVFHTAYELLLIWIDSVLIRLRLLLLGGGGGWWLWLMLLLAVVAYLRTAPAARRASRVMANDATATIETPLTSLAVHASIAAGIAPPDSSPLGRRVKRGVGRVAHVDGGIAA